MNKVLSLVIRKLALVLFIITNNNCEPVQPPIPVAKSKGYFVLCEGVFGKNNSVISYYAKESKSVTLDVFEQKNNSLLGDTGNDMIQYGSKIYIVVNHSGKIEVVNSTTFKSIKQISFLNGKQNRNPRHAIGTHGKVFVTTWDGTLSMIDTTSLIIEKNISLSGSYPEKMAVANNKLFVTRLGDFNQNYDGAGVSVVDLNRLVETNNILAGKNLEDIVKSNQGHLFVVRKGVYDASFNLEDPKIVVIDSENEALVDTLFFEALKVVSDNDNLLYVLTRTKSSSSETYTNHILTYNTTTKSIVQDPLFDPSEKNIQTIYRIGFQEGKFFVCDSKDYTSQGKVFSFDETGNLLEEFNTGVNPSVVLKGDLD